VLSQIAPFLALFLTFAGLGDQAAPVDLVNQTRLTLEEQRRELLADLADRAGMQNPTRATIARLAIERNWKKCAANEAAALAKASERPARLLAEAALTACRPWEKMLFFALENGADPYINGAVSHDDMVTEAQLLARDVALSRILTLRNVPGWPPKAAAPAPQSVSRPVVISAPSVLFQPYPKTPAREAPPAATGTDGTAKEAEIVVVAQLRNRCQVRLADRGLTEREFAAHAKQWAAAGTPLRIVRPHGATYGCIMKIVQHLGQYGVRLFEVVDP